MADMKLCVIFIFVIAMLLSPVQNHKIIADSPSPSPQPQPSSKLPSHGCTEGSLHPTECGGRCTERCSRTQYRKPCLFFCNKCCAKCLCVPAGYYGNKETCPCYNNWKTKRGGPKCP